MQFQQMAQAEKALIVGVVFRFPFFIAPVRRDAFFSEMVHFPRADLNFYRAGKRADDGGMQRLIHVRLGRGDVIVKRAGNVLPRRMNRAERQITIGL